MFSITFHKYVFEASEEDPDARYAVLIRDERLPFAPVQGHEVKWPLVKTEKITSSVWNTELGSFWCRLEDEYTINCDLDAPDFDEYLELALGSGWRIAETHPARGMRAPTPSTGGAAIAG